MDSLVTGDHLPTPLPKDQYIRKIEDIIELQKAEGNFTTRQVAFNLPSTSGSAVSIKAKSLEFGLADSNCTLKAASKKSCKKLSLRRHKSPLPDVISWPSDSDITVLRMKLCLTSNDLKGAVTSTIPGDGLHQPDSSSMVNLATLILQSRHPSKHSIDIDIEEFLLPLTSWEHSQPEVKEVLIEEQASADVSDLKYVPNEIKPYEAISSYKNVDELSSPSGYFKRNKKSKVAKFLRLYFCPCCTCLYRLERMRGKSSCFTNECREPIHI